MIMRGPCSEVAKVLDSGLEVSEFKPQSHYNFHFQTNAFGKGIKLPCSSAMR